MRALGITYDSGFLAHGHMSHDIDPAVVRRDVEIIRDDLGCDAIRITGGDPARIDEVAAVAAAAGLEVWFAPFTYDLTQDELRSLLVDCAKRAERLRAGGARVVLVLGAEISLFTHGFLPGATSKERMALLADRATLVAELPKVPARINAFLASAVDAVRTWFGGPLSYAAIHFERVDWSRFDYAGYDIYRAKEIASGFVENLTSVVKSTAKPVVATEYGCGTFRGAGGVGARGALALQFDEATGAPLPMHPAPERDEEEQAQCIRELVDAFDRAGFDATFLCTFSLPYLPRDLHDPARDFDTASYSIVAYGGAAGDDARYAGLPWLPKRAFDALAGEHKRLGDAR